MSSVVYTFGVAGTSLHILVGAVVPRGAAKTKVQARSHTRTENRTTELV